MGKVKIRLDDETVRLVKDNDLSVSEAIRYLYCLKVCASAEVCPCPLKIDRSQVSPRRKRLLLTSQK